MQVKLLETQNKATSNLHEHVRLEKTIHKFNN